jgi:hypothetical protein
MGNKNAVPDKQQEPWEPTEESFECKIKDREAVFRIVFKNGHLYHFWELGEERKLRLGLLKDEIAKAEWVPYTNQFINDFNTMIMGLQNSKPMSMPKKTIPMMKRKRPTSID